MNKAFFTLLIAFALVRHSPGQTVPSPPLPGVDSVGTIMVQFHKTATEIDLNDYSPLSDSCGAIEIVFRKPETLSISLDFNRRRWWSLVSIEPGDSLHGALTFTTTLLRKDSSIVKNIHIRYFPDSETGGDTVSLFASRELPAIQPHDSGATVSYELRRSVFACPEHPQAIIENREFVYPAWYMKREPVLNYPELGMFHYGKSIRIPSSESVRIRGIVINYWHILHPPDLKNEEPARTIPDPSHKPARKKRAFFTFKPIE